MELKKLKSIAINCTGVVTAENFIEVMLNIESFFNRRYFQNISFWDYNRYPHIRASTLSHMTLSGMSNADRYYTQMSYYDMLSHLKNTNGISLSRLDLQHELKDING